MSKTTYPAGTVLRLDGNPDLRYKRPVKTNIYGRKTIPTKPRVTIPVYSFRITDNRLTFLRNNNDITSLQLSVTTSSISCGVVQVFGVSQIENLRNNNIPLDIVKAGIKALFVSIKNRNHSGFAICSDNNSRPYANSVLDAICESHTEWRRNPNTGSTIRVYVI